MKRQALVLPAGSYLTVFETTTITIPVVALVVDLNPEGNPDTTAISHVGDRWPLDPWHVLTIGGEGA